MSLHIDAERMTCDASPHEAHPVDPDQPYGRWTVTWLPGRTLTRTEAITAMTLAEAVARMVDDGATLVDYRHPLWPHIDGWAAELGLPGPRAVVMVSGPLDDPTYEAWMAANRRSRAALE